MNQIKLTQYSHGAGCGCKIAPAVLDKMLAGHSGTQHFPQLLVGNDTRDDAAVYDIQDGRAIISTTDFFMPIVDDPADFGRIASVNAISDVYAMGGTPIMAIAILGWPVDKLPPEVAGEVLNGARQACAQAGIPLAGGHSIDAPEPIFGLSVTGTVKIEHLKKNGGAEAGNLLFLTKPLGVGIISTAQKKGIAQPDDLDRARKSMTTLNDIGAKLGTKDYVKALTDVTGFGLLGHLTEMCQASSLSAHLQAASVPLMPNLDHYLQQRAIPGGTTRNWDSYGHHIGDITERQRHLFCDPQTSGGLLVAVDASCKNNFLEFMGNEGFHLTPIGHLVTREDKLVTIQ
ncbi:selenide, water dikinase SelD [Roseivirga sp. BDSF3-8]|uniref:selenide, water dikinase SelD n=1 Tax=Roseivirga sp. BDSF3-8 TaxID=3241598 RepID=UPI0035326C45